MEQQIDTRAVQLAEEALAVSAEAEDSTLSDFIEQLCVVDKYVYIARKQVRKLGIKDDDECELLIRKRVA